MYSGALGHMAKGQIYIEYFEKRGVLDRGNYVEDKD
jgi:hypothetical protein